MKINNDVVPTVTRTLIIIQAKSQGSHMDIEVSMAHDPDLDERNQDSPEMPDVQLGKIAQKVIVETVNRAIAERKLRQG